MSVLDPSDVPMAAASHGVEDGIVEENTTVAYSGKKLEEKHSMSPHSSCGVTRASGRHGSPICLKSPLAATLTGAAFVLALTMFKSSHKTENPDTASGLHASGTRRTGVSPR